MPDSGKARRTRIDLINPPDVVYDDPAIGQRWLQMTRRIMSRWALLGICFAVPCVIIMVLTFRAQLIPETVAIVSVWVWGALAVGMAFVVRRWAQRQIDEFAERELSGQS